MQHKVEGFRKVFRLILAVMFYSYVSFKWLYLELRLRSML